MTVNILRNLEYVLVAERDRRRRVEYIALNVWMRLKGIIIIIVMKRLHMRKSIRIVGKNCTKRKRRVEYASDVANRRPTVCIAMNVA